LNVTSPTAYWKHNIRTVTT